MLNLKKNDINIRPPIKHDLIEKRILYSLRNIKAIKTVKLKILRCKWRKDVDYLNLRKTRLQL